MKTENIGIHICYTRTIKRDTSNTTTLKYTLLIVSYPGVAEEGRIFSLGSVFPRLKDIYWTASAYRAQSSPEYLPLEPSKAIHICSRLYCTHIGWRTYLVENEKEYWFTGKFHDIENKNNTESILRKHKICSMIKRKSLPLCHACQKLNSHLLVVDLSTPIRNILLYFTCSRKQIH